MAPSKIYLLVSLELSAILEGVFGSSHNIAFVSPALYSNSKTSWQKSQFIPLQSSLTTTQQLVQQKHPTGSTIYQAFSSDDLTELPPHTALAQVVANQYNIDLSSVEPSDREGNAKITAADVEFHAYKLSQPPTTPQALKLAYSYGLDLNILYEEYFDEEMEDGRPHYLTISDVELLKENLRSLRACTQTIRGQSNTPSGMRRKIEHMNELERRMEKNVGQLSEKAMRVVESVATMLQTVQSQVKLPIPRFVPGDSRIDSVQDFDEELANEIQAALASAGIDDEETLNLMSLLDVPLNGSKDKNITNGVNGSNQKETERLFEESTVEDISLPLFFADPK